MTLAPETTLSRNADILYAPVDAQQAVMLSISAGRYYGLNAVGSRIWEMLETPMTLAEICARLCQQYEVDAQLCETAVLTFVNDVVNNGLVHAAAAEV